MFLSANEKGLLSFIETLETEGGRIGKRKVAHKLRGILDLETLNCDCCGNPTGLIDGMVERCVYENCMQIICKGCSRKSLLTDGKICPDCEKGEDPLRESPPQR